MKKRPAIGLSITVLVLAVIIGIASLPDEVLIDSPSIENSKTLPEDIPLVPTLEESQDFISNYDTQKNLDDAKAEIDTLKNEMIELKNELVELKTNSQVLEENLPVTTVKDVTSCRGTSCPSRRVRPCSTASSRRRSCSRSRPRPR